MNTINIPVLALRGMTAFPGETVSFDVEREISIFALDNAIEYFFIIMRLRWLIKFFY